MMIDIAMSSQRPSANLQSLIEKRVRFALGRFERRLHRVQVRLTDENGPKGGIDKRCAISAELGAAGTLHAAVEDSDYEPAISRAVDRMARRVKDHLARRRDLRRKWRKS